MPLAQDRSQFWLSHIRMLCAHYSYACSWRRLSPCTDGMSGEGKDLWLFFFTDHLPDIIEKLAEGLQGRVDVHLACIASIQVILNCFTEKERGSWEDGMTTESSTMLYRSLHNIIERYKLQSLVPAKCFLCQNRMYLQIIFTLMYYACHTHFNICRSLMSEHYLPLGKWFAKPDSSVATDGR